MRPKCGRDKTTGVPMSDSTIWWVLAGAAVTVELMTGTFYLLMVAVGLVAAAVAAHLGATFPVELVVASVVGGGAVIAWRAYRLKNPGARPAGSNPDGTGEVKYRGANWQVSLRSDAAPEPGPHVIEEVIGNRLIVRKR